MEDIPIVTPKELKKEFIEKLRHFFNFKNEITGIPSGFKKLDELTNGFQPGDLILVGAALGMGKTSFAVSLLNNITIQNKYAAGFISLEITSEQLMIRMLSTATNINVEKLREGFLNKNEMESLDQKTKELENAELFIIDHAFLTMDDIRHEAYGLVYGDQIKILMLDELQLIAASSKDKANKVLNKKELIRITGQLKELAVELNIPIIVMVGLTDRKLGRKYYSRRPLLFNMRRQGGIDKKADVVLFLYRPEYYKIDEWDDDEHNSAIGQAEIIVAKNHNRSVKSVRVKFNGRFGRFENLEEEKSEDNDVPF